MGSHQRIWRHEKRRAGIIVRNIIETTPPRIGWRILVLPLILSDCFRFYKSMHLTRKNLLFTRRMAFSAARKMIAGSNFAMSFRQIEIKTQTLLHKQNKGLYTEKIRRKQLYEIELLTHHFHDLIQSNKRRYADMVRAVYGSRGQFQSFLQKLLQAEQDVIQASVTTLRRASKKERRKWFKKVWKATRSVRLEELKTIFPPEKNVPGKNA